MFGPFGMTKSGPHKHELTRSYPKLELRRALLIYIEREIESNWGQILIHLWLGEISYTIVSRPILIHKMPYYVCTLCSHDLAPHTPLVVSYKFLLLIRHSRMRFSHLFGAIQGHDMLPMLLSYGLEFHSRRKSLIVIYSFHLCESLSC